MNDRDSSAWRTPTVTDTMIKFGHPATEIGATTWWSVLFRQKQATLGSLILAAKCDVRSFAALPAEAFADLAEATRRVESVLKAFVGYDKINYLMLMMVDPHPHFHVIPRYSAARVFAGVEISDHGWPRPPALDSAVSLPPAAEKEAMAALSALWADAA